MTRIAIALACALCGCSVLPKPKPVRYEYLVLEASPPGGPAAAPDARATLALRAVELPGYLDRDEIVTRAGGNEVTYSRHERWAEPLATAVPRVLATELAPRLAARRISLAPLEGALADGWLTVAIERFERDAAGRAELRARWTLYDRERDARVAGGTVRLVDERPRNIAAGLSRLVGQLAEAIARDLRGWRVTPA